MPGVFPVYSKKTPAIVTKWFKSLKLGDKMKNKQNNYKIILTGH